MLGSYWCTIKSGLFGVSVISPLYDLILEPEFHSARHLFLGLLSLHLDVYIASGFVCYSHVFEHLQLLCVIYPDEI